MFRLCFAVLRLCEPCKKNMELAETWVRIFRACLAMGYVPTIWREVSYTDASRAQGGGMGPESMGNHWVGGSVSL
jgi:hypothetical protein